MERGGPSLLDTLKHLLASFLACSQDDARASTASREAERSLLLLLQHQLENRPSLFDLELLRGARAYLS